MKKFREFLNEEIMPYAQTEKGFVGVDNGPVRDNINIHLAAVTARPHATPYHAMEMVRKVLAPFSIFPPATNFLDGDSGHEVFHIKQFGDKMGMTNDGRVVVKNEDPYYVYFEYQMNDRGSFDIFCEIVDEDELEEIMSDIESEMEAGDTTDGDEADAEDSFDEYKAGNDLKEENLNEGRPSQRHPLEGHPYHKKSDPELEYIGKDAHKAAQAMKGHNSKAEAKYLDQANDAATVRYFRKRNGMPNWYKKKYGHDNAKTMEEQNLQELHGKSKVDKEKLKDHIYKKHGEAWYKTKRLRIQRKTVGPGKDEGNEHRNRLGKIYNKLNRK